MNNIIDKFLLARDNLIPEMHLGQPGFTFSVSELFTKNKTRIQKFNRSNRRLQVYLQEQSRSVLNKIWHMKISKIYQKRRCLIKYYVIRHSKLLVIQSMMDINVDWDQ